MKPHAQKVEVYDCFQFFNELDLLELRLRELYDSVDHFVLVEARQSHDGSPKPLFYAKNKRRFARWNDKIIHVVIDLPKLNLFDRAIIRLSKIGVLYRLTSKIVAFGHGRMKMDHFQRRQLLRGIKGAKDDDIIVMSDLDEIPNVPTLKRAIAIAAKDKAVALRQRHFIYSINGLVKGNVWVGTKVFSVKYLRTRLKGDPQRLRVPLSEIIGARLFGKKSDVIELPNGGWHFTYLGGLERVLLKKKVFAHSEMSAGKDIDAEKVKSDIERGVFTYKRDFSYAITYIPIDKSFPKTIVQDRKRFAKFIHPVKR